MISILATVDGSPESLAVIPAVEKLASTRGARVHLLTVVERPAPTRRESSIVRAPTAPAGGVPSAGGFLGRSRPAPETRFAETDDQAIERVDAEAHEFLETTAQRLRERGVQVETEVAMNDNPGAAIIQFAREGHFDLIAMATHGRSGLSELVQGSIASSVVKAGVAPVLLVRPSKA